MIMLEGLKTLKDMDFKGKKVFLRAGFDVPVDESGKILDDFRIVETIPTIKELIKKGASQIIIGCHQGRPKGEEPRLSTKNIAKKIFSLTKKKTEFFSDYLDPREEFPTPKEAFIVMLENLRFHPEEELDDEEFAKKLAALADVYVNDAFSNAHREHASMHAITRFLPGCIGLLVEKELKVFDYLLTHPEVPFMAILGGAKLETKIPIIRNLLDKTDNILLGGAMIFTFYKAKGYYVGKSIVDKNQLTMARMLSYNEKIILPTDIMVSDDMHSSNSFNMSPENLPSYMIGLDIGEKSVEHYKQILSEAKTVVWNGPLGYYENPVFAKATIEILKFLASKQDIKTIIGGGDSATIVDKLGLKDKFFHVSTGGGASMTLLEGKPLVAIEAIRNQ